MQRGTKGKDSSWNDCHFFPTIFLMLPQLQEILTSDNKRLCVITAASNANAHEQDMHYF